MRTTQVALDSLDLDAECQPSEPSEPSDDASTSCRALSLAQLRAKALAKAGNLGSSMGKNEDVPHEQLQNLQERIYASCINLFTRP